MMLGNSIFHILKARLNVEGQGDLDMEMDTTRGH